MSERSPDRPSDLAFLHGGGEMGARMRSLDWSKTPLGPPDTWPQSLRSTVSMLLPSKAQIILFWGPEFTVLYNDAYRPVFGAKHPQALGLPGREAWSEIWASVLHELLAGVVRTGEAFWAKDLLFELERYGFLEETYFDVSYDPVRGESGDGRRRLLHRHRNDRAGDRRAPHGVVEGASPSATPPRAPNTTPAQSPRDTLAAKPHDVTFALTYLDDELQCSHARGRGAARGREARAGEGLHALVIRCRGADRDGWWSASIRASRWTTDTARSSSSSPTRLAPRS